MNYFIFVTLATAVVFTIIGFLIIICVNSYVLGLVDDDWAFDCEEIGISFLLAVMAVVCGLFIFLILSLILNIKDYILGDYLNIYFNSDFFDLLTCIFIVILLIVEYIILNYRGFFLKYSYDKCKRKVRYAREAVDNAKKLSINDDQLKKLEDRFNTYKVKVKNMEIKLTSNGFGDYIY